MTAPFRLVPRRVSGQELRILGHESLVLDDQRNLLGRDGAGRHGRGADDAARHELPLDRVAQYVASRLAGVHVEASQSVCVVVVPHESCALLVGVEERDRSGPGIGHVGHVGHADALGVRGVLVSRSGPLVWRSVADPRSRSTVEVQRGAVLRVGTHAVRSHTGAHGGRVGRDEEVSAGTRGKLVDELHAHRAILLCEHRRSEVVWRSHESAGRVQLHVAAQLCRR